MTLLSKISPSWRHSFNQIAAGTKCIQGTKDPNRNWCLKEVSKRITVAAALHWLLLANIRQYLFRANFPTGGQNALPKHKTYKFGILSMMSCLKMISWQRKSMAFCKDVHLLMFTLLKMKVLISHRLCSFKGKFYNWDESQLQKIKVKKHQWCHGVLFNLVMSDDHVLLWS